MRNFILWNEEMAAKYDLQRYYETANLIIRYIEKKRIRLVRKMLSASEGDMVLEVGCGAGNVLEKMRGRLVGLDISERMLKKCKLRLKEASLIRADAESLPFSDKSFDKIIASELLEHTRRPDLVLKEIERVMKPSGLAAVTIPNEPFINRIKEVLDRVGILNLCFKGIPKAMDEEWHLHSFTLRLLKGMVPQGLMIRRIKSVPFWFLPLRFCVLLSGQCVE
jgi:ubiquinone/menaquinone biosynthesis C-methylase UbiE